MALGYKCKYKALRLGQDNQLISWDYFGGPWFPLDTKPPQNGKYKWMSWNACRKDAATSYKVVH